MVFKNRPSSVGVAYKYIFADPDLTRWGLITTPAPTMTIPVIATIVVTALIHRDRITRSAIAIAIPAQTLVGVCLADARRKQADHQKQQLETFHGVVSSTKIMKTNTSDSRL
jgi:hypothetical protein